MPRQLGGGGEYCCCLGVPLWNWWLQRLLEAAFVNENYHKLPYICTHHTLSNTSTLNVKSFYNYTFSPSYCFSSFDAEDIGVDDAMFFFRLEVKLASCVELHCTFVSWRSCFTRHSISMRILELKYCNASHSSLRLVYHLWCITSGASHLVQYLWCMTSGVWPLVHDLWCMNSGAWPLH